MTTAFVLHDLGDEAAGAPWRACAPAGWSAPDLPGHGATPAPRHGAYDPTGPLTLARWVLTGTGLVVGVGANAHAALVLAAGGGCDAAAVVDGLWGPWPSADDAIDATYAGLRRMLEDPGAVGPPPSHGLDPRTRHGYGFEVSERFCRRFWAAVTCPVLVVETPGSSTPPAERAERVGWFGGPATLVEVTTADPPAIVDAIEGWNARR